MSTLQLYSVFHLNLAYSSIEEARRKEVLRRCYWPLLTLAQDKKIPIGIEATGFTLEKIEQLDAEWIATLKRLLDQKLVELLGSGYAQIIGPLVPPEVNGANLRIGSEVYRRLFGSQPRIAMVNEQAFSAGLVPLYLDAGYQALLMEWNNPARFHPEWPGGCCYLPQRVKGTRKTSMLLIWNNAIAFQKFQRYAQGELELEELLIYLGSHLGSEERALAIYGNDAEIFDFRPGRYHTESALNTEGEWQRIAQLFVAIHADGRFRLAKPSDVLALAKEPGAGKLLDLTAPEQPIPVKKQGKYNITRWAVTGRDDLGINTACYRIFEAIKHRPLADDTAWKRLCALWASDFRTHITESRWKAYQDELQSFEEEVCHKLNGASYSRECSGSVASRSGPSESASGGLAAAQLAAHCPAVAGRTPLPNGALHQRRITLQRQGRFLQVETPAVKIRLNCRRGLAIEGLWFPPFTAHPLCGTLPHGYYQDIAFGADFYSGHLILESPGREKITDLEAVEPRIEEEQRKVGISCEVSTALGTLHKRISVFADEPAVAITYRLQFPSLPLGSLRLGHLTLIPNSFDRRTLFYRTQNGGFEQEMFPLGDVTEVDHGGPVSFLVSAKNAVGMTDGNIALGDATRSLLVQIQKTDAALIGLITLKRVDKSYFFRLALSAQELDETSRATAEKKALLDRDIRMTIRGG